MKSVVLYAASLLVLGFATLAASSESDDMLKSCNITTETDAALMECLEVQRKYRLQEIEKVRSQSVKNYDGLRLLFKNTNECFTKDKNEKKHCYIRAFSISLVQEVLHMNDIPFPSDDTVLYHWFRMNTMTVMITCGFNRDKSSKAFSCIKAFDRAANGIMGSKKLDTNEAYEKMLKLIRAFFLCARHLGPVQAKCHQKEIEVIKKKTAEDFQQQQELLVQKLETCEVSKNIIGSVTDCIAPLDEKLSVLVFKMLIKSDLFREFLRLRTQRENCIQQYPEVMQCRDAMPAKYDQPQQTERIFDTQQPMNMDIEE